MTPLEGKETQMQIDSRPGWTGLRVSLATTLALASGVMIQSLNLIRVSAIRTETIRWTLLNASWTLVLLVSAGLLLLTWLPAGRRFFDGVSARVRSLSFLRPIVLPLVILAALVSPVVVNLTLPSPWDLLVEAYFARIFLFWAAAVGGAVLLQVRKPGSDFLSHLAHLLVFYALLYRFSTFLPDISTHPFSLGWSEASRFYYASLFASERVYGVDIHPTVLHPSRYMLQSLPFLFGRMPIWVHRAWQVGLWSAAHLGTGWLLARRLVRSGRLTNRATLFAAWAVLFLFQGPIWYHLLVMVLIIFWGADSNRVMRTLLVVGAASIWAGISRVNWVPLPAALAGLIYLAETPREGRPVWRYLSPPAAWMAFGIFLGLASQWAYAVLSGNALDQFASSFSSDLLWYRLLPNTTYSPGILPGILVVFSPLLFVVMARYRGRWNELDGWRWLGIGALLLVFLLGGLLVSVKIGGGSNLHNLDGFIALVLAAAAYLYFEPGGRGKPAHPALVTLALVVPVAAALAVAAPFPKFDTDHTAEDLAALREIVESAAAQGGEVLFIAERHLLTFGEVEGVSLVDDYEKVFLMEMVMAGNRAYLDEFERQLAEQRFAVIVADKVNLGIKSRDSAFSEENNIWDEQVNYHLLCYYEAVLRLDTAAADILRPRAVPDCPEIKEVTP